MQRLYFKYGAMGSSKTASALMCRFNYMQKGLNVFLMKPALDNRFDVKEATSRIGLSAPCYPFSTEENLKEVFDKENEKQKVNVVIVDEAQFCTRKQVDQLREITEEIPVLCYGLKTNFKSELFEGSKRLLEIADSIQEIKCICECGKKAIMNGRFLNGLLVTNGEEFVIGGDERYKGLCYSCFKKEQQKTKIQDKIVKYLKIFKDMDDAGTWSTDTPMDNVVLQKPYVIYDEDVKAFVNDFKEFEISHPEQTVVVNDNIKDLKKISVKDKSFDYVMTLISYVLKMEKIRPGLLKTLIEDGTVVKWLKQIKKVTASPVSQQ